MKKQIVIEIEIQDNGDEKKANETMDRLFTSATEAVANPIGFIGMEKYKVLHQKIVEAKK